MTNDELLRFALLDAAAVEFAAELADTSPAEASPRLLRSMTAMLNDPNGWARRRRRPLWRRLARTVAVILLALSLSLGALMAVSPTVRATVGRWVAEWYETHVLFRFSGEYEGDPLAPMPRYEITAMPEGYEQLRTIEHVGSYGVIYANEKDEWLMFDYQRMTQGSAHGFSTENVIIFEVKVKGCPAQLFRSLDPEVSSGVIWFDENSGLSFYVDGFFDDLELLHIAESVCLVDSAN